MCTFLICTRQVEYCRYYNIPLYDQMIAVLKHSGFPRSCCFQIENTDSKLEENIGISQITELSIVNWAIIMCTFFDFCSLVWPRNADKKKSAENFPCGLLNNRLHRCLKRYTCLSRHFFTCSRNKQCSLFGRGVKCVPAVNQ